MLNDNDENINDNDDGAYGAIHDNHNNNDNIDDRYDNAGDYELLATAHNYSNVWDGRGAHGFGRPWTRRRHGGRR